MKEDLKRRKNSIEEGLVKLIEKAKNCDEDILLEMTGISASIVDAVFSSKMSQKVAIRYTNDLDKILEHLYTNCEIKKM